MIPESLESHHILTISTHCTVPGMEQTWRNAYTTLYITVLSPFILIIELFLLLYHFCVPFKVVCRCVMMFFGDLFFHCPLGTLLGVQTCQKSLWDSGIRSCTITRHNLYRMRLRIFFEISKMNSVIYFSLFYTSYFHFNYHLFYCTILTFYNLNTPPDLFNAASFKPG